MCSRKTRLAACEINERVSYQNFLASTAVNDIVGSAGNPLGREFCDSRTVSTLTRAIIGGRRPMWAAVLWNQSPRVYRHPDMQALHGLRKKARRHSFWSFDGPATRISQLPSIAGLACNSYPLPVSAPSKKGVQ